MARQQDKMLLISIGYSACHWCHVMEKEVFENEDAAVWMNRNFVCIKVDREERPDVDMVYMKAVQLMNGQGGWPLNCFALPDGRPVYGGTYFPLEKWLGVLRNLSEIYLGQRTKMEEYADRLVKGIQSEDLLPPAEQNTDGLNLLKETVELWAQRFDEEKGGPNRAPKFPLPDNYLFLLRYGSITKDNNLLHHVHLTLREMCRGGIYDQIGGGFSRYSTDVDWKVPHFEKMLYDNALLIKLYAEAYQAKPNDEYLQVIEQSILFCKRELKDGSGLYYAALDADSEGEEGKYYVWKKSEIEQVCQQESTLLCEYFDVTAIGNWEHGNNILLRKESLESFALCEKIDAKVLSEIVERNCLKLLQYRETRIRPGLDDKCLTSWNAMFVSGLCAAHLALGKKEYLEEAISIYSALKCHIIQVDYRIYHTYKNGQSKISGYLDDYSFVLRALLDLYYNTGEEYYLEEANRIIAVVFELFDEGNEALFLYKSKKDEPLIATGKEWQDNVIPSSNAVLAKVLFELGFMCHKTEWVHRSKKQLSCVQGGMKQYGSAYSHWAQLMLHLDFPFYQFVFSGEEAVEQFSNYQQGYFPNHISMLKRKANSAIKFLEGKDNGIYVCIDQTCSLPYQQWASVQKDFFD